MGRKKGSKSETEKASNSKRPGQVKDKLPVIYNCIILIYPKHNRRGDFLFGAERAAKEYFRPRSGPLASSMRTGHPAFSTGTAMGFYSPSLPFSG